MAPWAAFSSTTKIAWDSNSDRRFYGEDLRAYEQEIQSSKNKLKIVKEDPDTDEEWQKKRVECYENQIKKDEELLAKLKKMMADSKEDLLTKYSPEHKAMCYQVVVRICAYAQRKDGKEPTEGIPKLKKNKLEEDKLEVTEGIPKLKLLKADKAT